MCSLAYWMSAFLVSPWGNTGALISRIFFVFFSMSTCSSEVSIRSLVVEDDCILLNANTILTKVLSTTN